MELSSLNFLNYLLTTESGIDELYFDWYIDNWDKKKVDYFDVKSVGVISRDVATGIPIRKKITVRDYFTTLGVLEYFDPLNLSSLNNMKYRSINPWGFIGYQLGEQALTDCAIYIPEEQEVVHNSQKYKLKVNYIKLNNSFWVDGVEKKIVYNEHAISITIATSVNTWSGSFTGKFGINCKNDLFEPLKQLLVIKSLIKLNYEKLTKILEEESIRLEDSLNKPLKIYGIDSTIEFTLSGILACCHLCGYEATSRLILNRELSHDEINTSILTYLKKFSGFDVDGIIN